MSMTSSDANTLQTIRRWILAAIAAALAVIEAENNNGQMIAVVLTSGLMVHYDFAAHAALKSHRALAGLPLLYATLSGDIPLLAPRLMIQVGLLGLLYTFHHPLDVRVGKSVGSLRLRG